MKIVSTILLIWCALALSLTAVATDRPPAQQNNTEVKASPKATAMSQVELAPLGEGQVAPTPDISPMMAEIQATIDAAKKVVAELNVRYRTATDQETALALAKEAARVKHESRVAVMQIQLRYALEDGRDDTARQLEEAIVRMTAPPRVGQPRPRPVPEPATKR